MISTYKGRKVKENSLKRNANNLWGFDTSDYDLVNLFNQCQKKKRKEKKESLECDLRIKMEAIEGKKTIYMHR